METRVIKTEAQYREYRAEIGRLMDKDQEPGSRDAERLELLGTLVDLYEKERYAIPLPNPIDAILFRMEQQGLQQKDLVPFIGSKSKVSEVLSGKRRLTVAMIRALSDGLKLSADVLISEAQAQKADVSDEWSRFPIREMARRGWLGDVSWTSSSDMIDKVRHFFAEAGGREGLLSAYFRRTMRIGGDVETDAYALNAWIARVIVKSREIPMARGPLSCKMRTSDLLRQVAQLSWSEQGPLLAKEFLANEGIALVIEDRMPRTHLDGAALVDNVDGTPIVGLTIRHDRIDNFWFTLLHELAHVSLHLRNRQDAFVDNTDDDPDHDKEELEANQFAREALIPRSEWRRSDACRLQTEEAVFKLARELRIHPAIIVGRIRKETGNYKRLPKLIGQGEVGRLFGKRKKQQKKESFDVPRE